MLSSVFIEYFLFRPGRGGGLCFGSPCTLSDKISADKSAENLDSCRKFCPPKNFVRRKFCPPKYFVRRNFVQYYVKLKFYFYGTFSSNGSFQVILIHKSLMWRVSSPTCNVNNIGHLKFTHFKTNIMPSLRFTHRE